VRVPVYGRGVKEEEFFIQFPCERFQEYAVLRTFSSVAWESFAAASQNSRRNAVCLQRARNSRQCSP
jgi:hypothetical protein